MKCMIEEKYSLSINLWSLKHWFKDSGMELFQKFRQLNYFINILFIY